MTVMHTIVRFCFLLSVFIPALCGCATAPVEDMPGIDDPFESVNRDILDHTTFVDRLLVRPLAELYRATIPPGIRDRVAGILGDMKEPVIFANDVLQGDFNKAGITFERFGINTTLGLGGMWDVASGWGLPRQTGDFGQTLASWGVGEGPYLVLPFFGPSDARDAFGLGVDWLFSPWQYVVYANDGTDALIDYEIVYFGADGIVRREKNIERVDALRAGSIDYYAQLRSAYLQYRRRQIKQ
jgi:phospholipid-binding lipoprotein MlaA